MVDPDRAMRIKPAARGTMTKSTTAQGDIVCGQSSAPAARLPHCIHLLHKQPFIHRRELQRIDSALPRLHCIALRDIEACPAYSSAGSVCTGPHCGCVRPGWKFHGDPMLITLNSLMLRVRSNRPAYAQRLSWSGRNAQEIPLRVLYRTAGQTPTSAACNAFQSIAWAALSRIVTFQRDLASRMADARKSAS